MTSINLADRAVDLGEWAAVTPDADAVFARAVREWLDENLVGEYAQLRGRRARQRARVLHRAPRLEPAHGRGRLDLPGLAVALRRTRCDDESAHHLPQRSTPGPTHPTA